MASFPIGEFGNTPHPNTPHPNAAAFIEMDQVCFERSADYALVSSLPGREPPGAPASAPFSVSRLTDLKGRKQTKRNDSEGEYSYQANRSTDLGIVMRKSALRLETDLSKRIM